MIKEAIMNDIEVYDEKVEQAILARLRKHKETKLLAEMKLDTIQRELIEADEAFVHAQCFLDDYRKAHGLSPMSYATNQMIPSEFGHMGPTDLTQYWADGHDGEVVIKDIAKVAVNVGIFPNYRHASSSIYAVVKRKGFKKVGPGHFKKMQTSMQTQEQGGKNIPLPVQVPSQ
jgi:hypothetical protein